MSFKIIGTGKGIPKKSVTNNDLSEFLETDDEWISLRTGIKSRYLCTDETLCDLAVNAATEALKKADLKIGDMDLIICTTIGADYLTPSLACNLGERLGAVCPAFDINAACSGFIYALEVAKMYFDSGKVNNILIVSAEMMSKYTDWTDRSTCVLFGDAAGACVLARGDALKYIHLTSEGNSKILFLRTYSGNSPYIKEKRGLEYLNMDGQEVFKFAVSQVGNQISRALETLSVASKDIDYYLLHQANKRIIDSARARLKQPESKFPVNIDRYGNASSATVPVLLDEMLSEGKIKKGDMILMTAFGAGMTTGTCVMIWE